MLVACHDSLGVVARTGMRFVIGGLAGLLACGQMLLAESTPAADNAAADRLWQSFIAKYTEYSLHPLDPQVLDAKARAVLISTAGPRFRSWQPESQPTLLEMADAIMAKDGSIPKFERIEKTLTALLPQIDTYGHYRYAADVAQLNEALRQHPGSIHLTLDQAHDGRVLCFPLSDGPAELAGVHAGAQLLAVDQRTVEGKSLDALRLAFVGPPNSPITLKIKQPQGKIEELTVTRTDRESPIVVTSKTPLGVTVRIRRFDQGTTELIQQQLAAYPKLGRLTMDLRGNAGGLRDEALMTAALFFPAGTVLGKFTTKAGGQTATDRDGVALQPDSIQILQDGRTASAAEFLIAALKDGMPGKVTLFGKKTYGKSHSTVRVMLEGGGELAVTEALLATASGRSWDKTGIALDQADTK